MSIKNLGQIVAKLLFVFLIFVALAGIIVGIMELIKLIDKPYTKFCKNEGYDDYNDFNINKRLIQCFKKFPNRTIQFEWMEYD